MTKPPFERDPDGDIPNAGQPAGQSAGQPAGQSAGQPAGQPGELASGTRNVPRKRNRRNADVIRSDAEIEAGFDNLPV